MTKVTYYLEVISSWCYWAEPAWQELKHHFEGKVQFDWKIAQMPAEAYPVSENQCQWFYRRSGSIMRSPFMLSSAWMDPDIRQYTVPNYVAQAAYDMGVKGDDLRRAIADAALREGRKVGRWDVCVQVAAAAGRLDPAKLLARAKSPETANRVAATSAEFDALQVNQRPAFLIENSIGDRAVFSGVVNADLLAHAIDHLLQDESAYSSWKAHFGDPPAQ